jgi:asparaginyl-tRNA synthetase
VVTAETTTEDGLNCALNLSLECSVIIEGTVLLDEKQIGGIEIQVNKIEEVGTSENYPISKKEHGIEFLMDQRHLWLRSTRQWAIMRIRNTIIFSIHKYFQEQGFMQMDAPIFTGNACEGTSNLFETDFYGEPAYLSQSGQLYGEAMAMAMGRIYTFGPTFRAEKSKTRRHLSEFWMIEPEMAFYDIFQNMDCIEGMLQAVIKDVLANCKSELETIGRDVAVLESSLGDFPRMTYDHAMKTYGNDKPDIRFGMEFGELNAVAQHKDFPVFNAAELVVGIAVPGAGELTRKEIDGLIDWIKRPQIGASGMVYVKCNTDGTHKSSVDKFYDQAD